jgi:hypothetical protein
MKFKIIMDQHKTAIRNGLIWAAISIATTLLLYLLGMMENVAAGILLFLLGIYIMYRSGAEKRTELGGYITWKEALTPTWLTAVVSSFFTSIFTWILFKFIDPSLQEKQKEQAIKMTEKMRSWMGDAEAEKQLEELEKKDFASFTIYIQYFAIAILLYFIIASIISLVLKRKRQEDIFSKY